MNILDTARKAAALYEEAGNLIQQVKTAVASSSQALSTSDQAELNRLLAEAQERRRAASADLEEALAALG